MQIIMVKLKFRQKMTFSLLLKHSHRSMNLMCKVKQCRRSGALEMVNGCHSYLNVQAMYNIYDICMYIVCTYICSMYITYRCQFGLSNSHILQLLLLWHLFLSPVHFYLLVILQICFTYLLIDGILIMTQSPTLKLNLSVLFTT